MRKLVLVGVSVIAGAVVFAGFSVAAAAGAYMCSGTLSSGTYHKLVVPAGAICDGTVATILVRGGVSVRPGATFILGHDGGGPAGTINGGVVASGASSVQVHFAHINGGVSIEGGEGFFSTVEDSVIHGGATINGYRGFWLGFIRNMVSGSVTLSNNVMDDPDANEFVTNTIRGNLACFGNSPAPQVGDSEGLPNVVTGHKLGQCAGL
jgi:hypothetical protein